MTHRTDDAELDMDAILDQAEDALSRGDTDNALTLCSHVLQVFPDHSGALFLSAEAYRDRNELSSAEAGFRSALRNEAKHAPAWSGLAEVLYAMLRFDEALHAANRAIRLAPEEPDGWWWRGLVRERQRDFRGSDRDLRRASIRDPISFPWPVAMSDAMIEAVVSVALADMHPSIRAYMEQVTILLEEIPALDVLEDFDPPPPPSELIGLFSGYSLHDRSTDNPWSNLPSAIVLYRRNLERFAVDQDMLIEELRITILHEVGHFLGLDESDLTARGLD